LTEQLLATEVKRYFKWRVQVK